MTAGYASTSRACGDCAVPPGTPHVDGCDVARCTECGWQRISCEHDDADVGWGQVWSGTWPGEAECIEFGWWVLDRCAEGLGFVRCEPGTPGATPDLNRLAAGFETRWDRASGRFVLATTRRRDAP